MKILVLSFYYSPDLCAGSFRTTALVEQLKKYGDLDIEIITTLPNRYATYSSEAQKLECYNNVMIHRIALPSHKSGMLDQAKAFYHYYSRVKQLIKGKSYDAVYATSSRLFTAFLGARISRTRDIPLYLDIRDIFVDTIKDVLPAKLAFFSMPIFSAIERYTFSTAKRINLVSKGFASYFKKRYANMELRWFTNGIDDVFIGADCSGRGRGLDTSGELRLLYAGNIGEGQGLHTIIPGMAKQLEGKAKIRVIGDGGRKFALQQALSELDVSNVELAPPVNRDTLIEEYCSADVLFLHLNDYPAFEKVLPSKIFEYAALGKPVLAGVAGYSASFLKAEVSNCRVFQPGNVSQGISALSRLTISDVDRKSFKEKFSRRSIADAMARDIYEFTQYAS